MQLWEKLNELDGHNWTAERRAESLFKVSARIHNRCPNRYIRRSKVIDNHATPTDKDILIAIVDNICGNIECWFIPHQIQDAVHNTCIMRMLHAEWEEYSHATLGETE